MRNAFHPFMRNRQPDELLRVLKAQVKMRMVIDQNTDGDEFHDVLVLYFVVDLVIR